MGGSPTSYMETVLVDDMFSDAPSWVLEAIVVNVFLKTDKEERIIDDYMCGTETQGIIGCLSWTDRAYSPERKEET
ncbi:MAG: hypothetical protein E7Z70_04325 [Thermoplasmata archaeon]|nr:hypothetical protein [Thermoplasmata archaeon]